MWGFNVTGETYSYDNRPVTPLMNYNFQQWWFHNHLDHPPNPGDFFELPAGKAATTELACNKGATTYFNSSEGGDIRDPNNPNDPCPGSDMSEWHTKGIDDLFGCALAITYKSDVTQVKPEDFTVFSVNQTCVWTRFTDFQVPAAMPPCPEGGCICAWFWIHSPDSGGEQNYMNGFRCNVTGSMSNVALAQPQIPRRCGADPANGKMQGSPGNCTYGAKQPFYWFQLEQNNMFEGTYSPPRYTDMYNFKDGAQDDIFENSYPNGIPPPSPNSTVVPTPVPFNAAVPAPTSSSSASSISSTGSSQTHSTGTASSLLSQPPSVSVSVSVATVVSTATVTQSASALATPSSSTLAVSTSTVTNLIFVTVTGSATPSTTVPSAASTSTVFKTIYASVTETASSSATSALASIQTGDTILANMTMPKQAFAELDVLGPPNSTSTSAGNGLRMCKRDTNLSPRMPKTRSKWLMSVPGLHSHRKMKKRSALWNIF